MDDLNSASTFWRTCDPNGQNCHCDWRLSLYSCAETVPIGIIFRIQAIWAAVVAVLDKGQRLFDTRRGYMRPQPVESMVVFAFIFNVLRMIHSIIILKDYDENYIFRSFLFEIPWQFGFGAFAAYLWGIGTTVFDSETVIDGGWRLSPESISKIGFSFMFSPMLTNNVCSIASGAFAQQGDAYKADIFARLLYAFWTFYCTSLAVCVIYSGVRLMKLLGKHLEMIGSGKRYDLVKHGRIKVCWIMSVTGLCLICFAVVLCSYAIWRPEIMTNTAANITWSILWNYAGPTATLLIEVALFIESCDAQGNNCHCDLRLELMDCLDTYPASIVMKLQVALSAAVTLAACGILTFRLLFRDQKLVDYRGGRAQPQPILSMFILGTTFNMLRMLHAIFLLTETAQSKVVRSVLFDLSFQFGFATFAAYLIGIAAAVFNSNTVVTGSWKLTQSQITKIGFAFIVLPVLTNNPISVLIGIYADADNVYLADLFTRLLYSLWGFYCICLSSCILYAGFGLIRLLDSHIRTVVDGRRHDVFKTGRIKVRMIMTASCLCLLCFILLVLVYMIWKPLTFTSVVYNVCIAIVWNFAGPVATFFIEVTFLIDPKMLKAPTFSATGSSSFGQKTEDSAADTTQRGSFINAQLQGTRFSQHGHELKIYNAGRNSMSSDAKYLMMQQC